MGNPMILNVSSTSTITIKTSKNMQSILDKLQSIKPTLNKSKSLKLVSINSHKKIQIVSKRSDKYTDKMPQSPHLNPPQERGYNNDDSLDDDDDKSQSFVEELQKSPSLLDISAPNIIKNIVIIPSKQQCRRSRSYAVGLKNEWNLSPYCTVTDDDDATTDFDVFSGSSGDHKDSPFRKKAKIIKNTCSFRYDNDKLWL